MTPRSLEDSLPCPDSTPQNAAPTPESAQDAAQDAGLARLQQVMLKARRGENIVIAGLGGSITYGDAARQEKRYIAQVYNWWNEKFPRQVWLINAGLGATGSGFGTHRLETDLLDEHPDFVMIDFAVNDLGKPERQATFEGVVRKILTSPDQTAVMLVYFAVKSGDTTQADFAPIAEHYQLAQVSFGDRIRQVVEAGEITLDDVYADDVHPNSLGHTYAANFIIEYLDSVYDSLPSDDADIPIVTDIPAPLYTDTFQYTQVFHRRNATPIMHGNWTSGSFSRRTGSGWIGEQVGDELIFEDLLGSAFGIVVRQEGNVDFGMVEVQIDDGPPQKVDTFMPASAGWYGPAATYHLIAQGLPMTTHTLHVKIIDEKHPETGDNTNHIVEIVNVFADGALVDNLGNWNYSYAHTGDFEFDFPPAEEAAGDRSRVFPTGEGPAEIVWHYRDFTNFEAVFFYPPAGEVSQNVFCVSADGANWALATPLVEDGVGDPTRHVYTLSDITGVSYVKTIWTNATDSLVPALGSVAITRTGE